MTDEIRTDTEQLMKTPEAEKSAEASASAGSAEQEELIPVPDLFVLEPEKPEEKQPSEELVFELVPEEPHKPDEQNELLLVPGEPQPVKPETDELILTPEPLQHKTGSPDLIIDLGSTSQIKEITFEGQDEGEQRIADAMDAYDKAMDDAAYKK